MSSSLQHQFLIVLTTFVLGIGMPLNAYEHYFDDFLTTPYTEDSRRWSNYRETGTTVFSPGPHAAPYYANWLASGGSFPQGYIFIQHQATAIESEYVLHTDTATSLGLNPSTLDYQSLYAKWEEEMTEPITRHLAMLVDGQWYVSEKSTALSNGRNRSMDILHATWHLLDVTTGVGGSISIDSSQTYNFRDIFSSGAGIDSFGYYVDMPAGDGATRTIRFDKVTLTSGIHWGGTSGLGGTGVWETSSTTQNWKNISSTTTSNQAWQNNETAIFGHQYATGGPGTITVATNIVARTLEFYENADGYVFLGNIAPAADLVPNRVIQLNGETDFRQIYLAPNINVTIGGDPSTGLRIYRNLLPLHLYGGGQLTIAQNGMVRTEGGGDLILNDGTTVEVLTGGQFNASKNLYLGNAIDTHDHSIGSAHLILNGGTTITRTGNSGGGDVIMGGADGTARLTVKNNGSLTVNGAAPNGIVIAGNSIIELESGGILRTRKIAKQTGATGTAELRFNGGTLIVNAASPSGPFIDSNIDSIKISGGGATINTNGFDTTILAPLTHDASGPAADGGFIKAGNGILTMDLDNTYTGATVITGGTLKTNTFNVLGASSNAASNFVLNGGTFWLTANGVNTNRQLTVGPNGGTLKASATYRIHGQVHAAAGTTLSIDGSAWLSGDNSTTFHGNIDVIGGEFLVRRARSLGSTQGGITVRSGATFNTDHNGTGGGGNVATENNYMDHLTLEQNATFGSRGRNPSGTATETIYSGNITLLGPGTSTIRVVNQNGDTSDIPDIRVTGIIQGAGALLKTGNGKLVLTNQNTYAGKTQVDGGTIALSGSGAIESPWVDLKSSTTFDVSALSQPYSLQQQTLSGTGSIQGSLVFGSGTYLKPGNSSTPSQLSTAGDNIGQLHFSNDLSLGAQSTAVLQIGGTAAHDKLVVLGAFNALQNSTIEVQWNNFQGALGDTYDLIDFSSSTWGSDYQANLLSRLILPSFSNSGLTWDTSDFMQYGILRVAAIPEPTRVLLSFVAFLLCLAQRRRA